MLIYKRLGAPRDILSVQFKEAKTIRWSGKYKLKIIVRYAAQL